MRAVRVVKRGGYLKRRTPLRVIGKKVQRDQDQMRAARQALLERSGGRCEGKGFSELCTGVGVHAHHVKRRAQGAGNDPEQMLWLCAACHQRVHDNPAEATAAGLLKPSWS